MVNKYANAEDVLPPELLAVVQRHHAGLLWVPDARSYYRDRNARIVRMRAGGAAVREIAQRVRLSERRVWQILRSASASGAPTAGECRG